MPSSNTRAMALKAQKVRAAWDALPLARKAAVYEAVRGQAVAGVEVLAAKELASWFYANWSTAYAAITGMANTDVALKAANWLDSVGEAIAESAARVKKAVNDELLFVALLAAGVLLAYGYAARAK